MHHAKRLITTTAVALTVMGGVVSTASASCGLPTDYQAERFTNVYFGLTVDHIAYITRSSTGRTVYLHTTGGRTFNYGLSEGCQESGYYL